MSEPVLSVLLPVRNGEATLARALDSLLVQSEPDFELLAVDDGSTDGTARILEEFSARDARVRVVAMRAGGIVAALNEGLALCRGRYVARMDADDVCDPSRLELQRQYLDGNPLIGVVGCRVSFGGDARAAGFAAYVQWSNSLVDPGAIALRRFVESPLVHPSVCFRREIAERHGTWRDGPFPEDYELWLRWMERGVRVAKVHQELLCWSDPPGRLSRGDPRYSPGAFWECKAGYLARFVEPRLADGRSLVFWGAGRRTRVRARPLLGLGLVPAAWVDIDPRKVGARIAGVPVVGPDELPSLGRPYVVSLVTNRGAGDEIAVRLASLGFREGADFVLAG